VSADLHTSDDSDSAVAVRHADILVVDDDSKTHVALQAVLGEMGAELVSVTSGKEALLRLLRQDFALVLLDVQMPDMDGFTTAELIRGRDKTRHTPIIFLTAHNQTDSHQLRGYGLGAVDFLFKPIVPEILRSKVQVFVDLHRKNQELRRQAALIRAAEQRENERRIGEARQRWEAEALREQMETQRAAAGAMAKKAEELAHAVAARDEAARALTRSNARLSLLSDTANRLLMGQEPHTLARDVFERLTRHLDLDFYGYRELDDTGELLSLRAAVGVGAAYCERYATVRVGETTAGQAARDRHVVIVDADNLEEVAPGAAVRELDSSACAVFPLIAHDRLIGTLAFGTRRRPRFSTEELAVMQMVADQVAIALERDRLVKELQSRNVQLADADRRKDEFLAMLGHELRNPLAPIVNALHVIGHVAGEDSSLAKAHKTMERQVRHLVRLVDDLLDVSRITQGKIELRREKADIRAIIEQALTIARPLIVAREHYLSVNLPDEPIEVVADVTRLTQVIANLLNNAAKYTNRGGSIELLVVRGSDEEVVISIKDTGIGLKADMLPRVFDLFVQAEHATDRAAGGLGIGLTLVKRLIQLHGGDVVAKSDGPNRGSEFIVTLPLGTMQAAEGESPAEVYAPSPQPEYFSAAGESLDILVVEDNADIRETLKELLEICGHKVTLAEDGNSGIAAASNGTRHDVALIDIGLPGKDGYDVARELSSIRKKNGHNMRLIAMTGYGQAEDRRRAIEAGFDDHLVKPVDPETLTKILSSQPAVDTQAKN
jgi:signal transduction histidine kinase/CheY-like chemotaxis protein